MEEGLLEILREAVEFVKGAAPELWAVAVRQSIVGAVKSLVWSVFISGVAVYFFRKGKVLLKESKDTTLGYEEKDFKQWMAFLSLGGAVTAIIIVMILLDSFLGRILNPNYYAIYTLLNMGK